MGQGLRRGVLALVCALAAAVLAPAVSGAATVGISNQTPEFMTDPLFTALHIRNVRLTVDWDVAVNNKHAGDLAFDEAWLAQAQKSHMKVLISFSRPGGTDGNFIPSVKQYTAAVKAFEKKFRWIKTYTAWNEPDWVYLPKMAKHPALAASFFNALAKSCKHCTVLAGDVYLPANQLTPWLRQYVKALKVKPSGWALHNYYDVRQHSTHQLKALEKLTRGPIWLDEISGVERRGHWQYKNQSANAAARDEKFLFSLPKKDHRISHIFHYQWEAVDSVGWDSGLLDSTGTPRKAYFVVKKAA